MGCPSCTQYVLLRLLYTICLEIAQYHNMLLEFLAIFLVFLLLVYRWSTANFGFFKDQGIEYAKPYPFVGSMWDLISRKKSMFDHTIDLYNRTNNK